LNGPERFFDLFPKKCFTNIWICLIF
jgi:hypothetical protein